MTDEEQEKAKELQLTLLPIVDQSVVDELPCGSIIRAKTNSGYPGPVVLFKNGEGEWKMFDIKGIQVEEREGDFTPSLPVVLVLFGHAD